MNGTVWPNCADVLLTNYSVSTHNVNMPWHGWRPNLIGKQHLIWLSCLVVM